MKLTRQKSLSECNNMKRDSAQSLIDPVAGQNFKSAEMVASGAEKPLEDSGVKKQSIEAQGQKDAQSLQDEFVPDLHAINQTAQQFQPSGQIEPEQPNGFH